MENLKVAINGILPSVVNEWNTVKLGQFTALYEQSFEDYFKGRKTQEKTKVVSPILDSIFARNLKQVVPTFEVDEGKGRDYCYGDIPIESKITFGNGHGWTGNGYGKTPWHLLMRFNLTETGVITSYFAMLANLDECKSNWTAPGDKSNFSTLQFLVEDKDKLQVVTGSVSDKTKTGKDSTYIKPVMVDV